MSLFQPSYVSPDNKWGVGNGTVDVTQGIAVSWRVNGNSAMTAFKIDIHTNDAASTLLYTTNKLTTNCPFYNTTVPSNTADETPELFSYTIPAGSLSMLSNGNEYKLIITQWWSATQSVAQSSASVFQTRSAPTLTFAPPATITAKQYTFTATYSQAEGDGLNWIRWQIKTSGNIIYDSQSIYSPSVLSMTYDGFITGLTYSSRVTAETVSGVSLDSGWKNSAISYSVIDTGGVATALQGCDSPAVTVQWTDFSYVPGIPTGNYQISGNNLILMPKSKISWYKQGTENMAYLRPWYLLAKASVYAQGIGNGFLQIFTSDGTISVLTNRQFYTQNEVQINASTTSGQYSSFTTQQYTGGFADVSVLLANDSVLTAMVRIVYYSGGLYPSNNLKPSSTLYPATDTQTIVIKETNNMISIGDIIQINAEGDGVPYSTFDVYHNFTFDYIQAFQGTVPASVVTAFYDNGTYNPSQQTGAVFNADFTDGLNAGVTDLGGQTLTGYAIYREKANEALTQVGVISLEEVLSLEDGASILDYSCGNMTGPYKWYIFAKTSTSYATVPYVSNSVTPCFWDWCILSCTKATGKTYQVNACYLFGNNLSSGDISNNNKPNVAATFTRYPSVQRTVQQYQSGTLQSLIGAVVDGQYADTATLRDAIWGLSTTQDTLFLKNRKGDVLKIAIAGPISMKTADETKEQALSVSIPWCEIGSTDGIGIYEIGNGVVS